MGLRNRDCACKTPIAFYIVGPIFPLPFADKKLDFSPSLVTRNVPSRKSTGTATKRRVAAAPKLVVSIETNGYPQKLSLTGPIKLIPVRALHGLYKRNNTSCSELGPEISLNPQAATQLRSTKQIKQPKISHLVLGTFCNSPL